MAEDRVYSVTELNRVAREFLEEGLGPLWVKGEVSNLVSAPSGHLYFTLKDAESEVSAVRFKGRASLLPSVVLKDGLSVVAYGHLTVYEPRGRYQFVVSLLQGAGLGTAQLEFERLKEKLKGEGLFDAGRKRSLPPFPQRIGVVTSPSGAALRDILSVLERRWPLVEVYLFPSAVQGETAPLEIVEAIRSAATFKDAHAPIDVLIVGRGGGSLEDLAAFNDERVARAISACPIPVVSAVGHEIDFTIADFVADVRAPTPSAAAELAVPDSGEIPSLLRTLHRRLAHAIRSAFDRRRRLLETGLRGYIFRIPLRKAATASQSLDLRLDELHRSIVRTLEARDRELLRLEDRLPLVDPRLPLRRGYCLTYTLGDPSPLRDPGRVSRGETIETRFLIGKILSRVEEVSRT